jgi:hypothetical protein
MRAVVVEGGSGSSAGIANILRSTLAITKPFLLPMTSPRAQGLGIKGLGLLNKAPQATPYLLPPLVQAQQQR